MMSLQVPRPQPERTANVRSYPPPGRAVLGARSVLRLISILQAAKSFILLSTAARRPLRSWVPNLLATERDAPPTGHPMVRWQTSLRATEPPCCNHASCPWKSPKPHSEGPSTPALQKKKSRDLSCSGKASTGVTQDLAAPQRRRALPSVRRMAEESSDPGDAQLHAQLHTESKGSHQQETHLDHKQVGTPLLAAALIAEQQGLVPASRAQPCQQHLRQRYLPVYSVFDEKESTAGGTQELIRARLIRQCTPRAADTPELASEAASQQQFGDKFSSHAPLTCTQEEVVRAALQRFAMRVT